MSETERSNRIIEGSINGRNISTNSNKAIFITLRSIYGIGRSKALKILEKLDIHYNTKTINLTEEQFFKIKEEIETNHITENNLREDVTKNILNSNSIPRIYHKRSKGLPISGRSRTNGSTAKKHRIKLGASK